MNRWDRIHELFNEARRLGKSELDGFLATQCGSDKALRLEVESLLDSYQEEFLESSPHLPKSDTTTQDKEPALARDLPDFIGPHRVLQFLGKGGMGIVYLAQQTEPLRRRVAIKVIKLGMDTEEVLARFRTELQALALMDHPNIAQVYDAGSTERGRPYFVMEHVPGIPITDYCDEYRLSLRRRLKLFLQVCDAVQHAHQKGIIHRDIKPSNVLVMLQGEKPVPKIIDFGVAKSLNQPGQTVHTEQGRIIGTVGFMSPEQTRTSALAVDTRSDIYSLGVLLYTLLAGALPFEFPPSSSDLEMLRIIQDEEPPKPSTRLRESGETLPELARKRHEDARSLVRAIRGDLDCIALKAMAKDPVLRYSSASELAADVERHLQNEPVTARPPSLAYRCRKLIRKHRGAAAATLVVLVLLIAGFAISMALYLRSDRAIQSILRLADIRSLDRYVAEADKLWPAVPANVEKMEQWLDGAQQLARRLDTDKAALSEFLVEQEELETLGQVAEDLDRFKRETIPSVEERLGFARSVARRSLEAHKKEWDEARAAIKASSLYGFDLAPQIGLVPIGKDPRSQLWEFAHLQTGEPPSRGADGQLILTEKTGLVFVLIPGGPFQMGAVVPARDIGLARNGKALKVDEVRAGSIGEKLGLKPGDLVVTVNQKEVASRDDLKQAFSRVYSETDVTLEVLRGGEKKRLSATLGPNVDPEASPDEGPVHEVTLDPFFLSKYEMTQSQWQRFTGHNPSSELFGRNPLYPVEQVSWTRCAKVLWQLGLVLPTEAQWEYGTRAKSNAVWSVGNEKERLPEVANLADLSCKNQGYSWDYEEWDDGAAMHARVGSLQANAFGLHDVHGNVWEWCRDNFGSYRNTARPGDGLREVADSGLHVMRGGDFIRRAVRCRSATRYPIPPELRFWTIGVRPAREISP